MSKEPLRFTFTERLLTDDAKAIFNQASLDTGVLTVDHKVLVKMIKPAFPAYTPN